MKDNHFYYTAGVSERGRKLCKLTYDSSLDLGFTQETEEYNVSKIVAYNKGIQYDGQLCTGAGEEITVTPTVPEDHIITGIWYNETEIVPDNGVYFFKMPSEDVSVTMKTEEFELWDGEGTEASPYIITSLADWNRLRQSPDYNGSCFKLADDLTVNTMIGTEEQPFTGSFDGNGHTITATLIASEERVAPFRYVADGALIQNLRVAGSIDAKSYKYGAGLVANLGGKVTIQACRVSAAINGASNGDLTNGGFVARSSEGSELTIEGCVFDGKLLTSSANAGKYGGFVGYAHGKARLTDCLFAPAQITLRNDAYPNNTFVRASSDDDVTLTNCLYTAALTVAQGTKVYPVPEGEHTALDFENYTASYAGSSLCVFTAGMSVDSTVEAGKASGGSQYSFASPHKVSIADGLVNGSIAAEPASAYEGDTVKLIFTPEDGYAPETVTVTYGSDTVTVTDNAFTMPAGDVTVSATFVEGHFHDNVAFQPWTATDLLPTEAGNYYLANDVTLTGNAWRVPSGITNLCLNGKTITTQYRILMYTDAPVLRIYDEDGGGKITGCSETRDGGAIHMDSGELVMYGGTITGNATTGKGGGVCLESSASFTMYGGAITNNTVTGDGGGIYMNGSNASVTIHGGTISGNTTTGGSGGGVYAAGQFTMDDGTISDNTTASDGCGVYSQGKALFAGGTISGNASSGGEGGDQVCASYASDNGTALSGTTIDGTLTLKHEPINIAGSLEDRVYSVALSDFSDESLIFTSGLSGNGDASNFASVDSNYAVGLAEDGEAQLVAKSSLKAQVFGYTLTVEGLIGVNAYLVLDGGQSGGETADVGSRDAGGSGDVSGSEAETPDGNAGQAPASSTAQGASEVKGIPLGDDSVVTVDGGGALVVVSPSGATQMLDDSRAYTLEERADGTATIRDSSGNEVAASGTTVSFTNSQGERVSVEVAPGGGAAASAGNSAASSSGAVAQDQATSGGSASPAADETELGGDEEVAKQQQEPPVAIAVIAAVAAIAVIAAVVIRKRRSS